MRRYDKEKNYSDIDVEIIACAIELDHRLRQLAPDDRREWAAELRGVRDRIFAAFSILDRELGTPPSGEPQKPRHLRLV